METICVGGPADGRRIENDISPTLWFPIFRKEGGHEEYKRYYVNLSGGRILCLYLQDLSVSVAMDRLLYVYCENPIWDLYPVIGGPRDGELIDHVPDKYYQVYFEGRAVAVDGRLPPSMAFFMLIEKYAKEREKQRNPRGL